MSVELLDSLVPGAVTEEVRHSLAEMEAGRVDVVTLPGRSLLGTVELPGDALAELAVVKDEWSGNEEPYKPVAVTHFPEEGEPQPVWTDPLTDIHTGFPVVD